jgi:hypothetical protein
LPWFAFSQIEVPWALGPPDGRYLVREPAADAAGQPTHVLVFATLGAAPRSPRGRKRRAVDPSPEPALVTTGRATVIAAAEPFVDAAAAARWLATAGEAELASHLEVLTLSLHTFQVVTADPYSEPVGRDQLLVARVGYGQGEEVADGQWSEARELLPANRRVKRSRILEPQSRLAAALGQRLPVLICEELALRARRDLDAGRARTATLQLQAALAAGLVELSGVDGLAARVDELVGLADEVSAAAESALLGELSVVQLERVRFTLGRLEAALRARVAESV